MLVSVLVVFGFIHIQKHQGEDLFTVKSTIGNSEFNLRISFSSSLIMVGDTSCKECTDKNFSIKTKTFEKVIPRDQECVFQYVKNIYDDCSFKFSDFDGFQGQGVISKEELILGKYNMKNLVFGRIMQMEGDIGQGILGLAPAQNHQQYQYILLNQLFSIQEHWFNKVISICMVGNTGYIQLGGYDSSYSREDFYVFPLIYSKKISVPFKSILINQKEIQKVDQTAYIQPAVLEILLPIKMIDNLRQNIKELYGDRCDPLICQQGSIFRGTPLNNTQETPQISFIIQHQDRLKLTIRQFIIQKNNSYYSMIKQSPNDKIVFGQHMLKSLYVTIDFESSSIGIAQVKNCSQKLGIDYFQSWSSTSYVLILGLMLNLINMLLVIYISWKCRKSYELEFKFISVEQQMIWILIVSSLAECLPPQDCQKYCRVTYTGKRNYYNPFTANCQQVPECGQSEYLDRDSNTCKGNQVPDIDFQIPETDQQTFQDVQSQCVHGKVVQNTCICKKGYTTSQYQNGKLKECDIEQKDSHNFVNSPQQNVLKLKFIQKVGILLGLFLILAIISCIIRKKLKKTSAPPPQQLKNFS